MINKRINSTELLNINTEKTIEKFLVIEITIIDTGLGISEEGLKHLFMNFGKLAENAEHNKGGTGLGLSICK